MCMQLFSSPVFPLTREYLKSEIPTNNSIEQKRRLLYFFKLTSTPRMQRIARISAGWPKAIAHWCMYCWDFKSFFFTHSLPIFTERVLGIFHALYYRFHVCHFLEIFTDNAGFSRVTLNIFSRRGSHFHGQKTIFFHAQQTIFHVEKKKHCISAFKKH